VSRITSYKIGRLTQDEDGQRWVQFRYTFNDGTKHTHGPVPINSREDALAKCKAARREIDSNHRKQHPDCPPRRMNTPEERAIAEAEVED
jgi:hypothetical protein